MPLPTDTLCPSCRAPMAQVRLANHHGGPLLLDLCHACHGIWFDEGENRQLAPQSVVELFKLLHENRDDETRPLTAGMGCPRCRRTLLQGSDWVKSGRYTTWRCPSRHGRFATFSAFMVEKGFVRQLTKPEIDDLAARVRVIHCTSCGAPVDLRKDHACPYCGAAFSLLDPQAVAQALAGYGAKAQRIEEGPRPVDLADALVAIERDRERAKREEQKERWKSDASTTTVDDLWSAGVELVWNVLRR